MAGATPDVLSSDGMEGWHIFERGKTPDGRLKINEGDCIDGPDGTIYKFIRQLGQGAFGSVYEVVSLDDQKHFAMKISACILESQAEACTEITVGLALKQTGCQSAIPLIAHFECEGHYFMVTELCVSDFLQLARRSLRMRPLEMRDYLREIIEGVLAIHNVGYVHCDIKPENILVAADGRLKIADFGSAREPASEFEYYMCTRFYRAPEIHFMTHVCEKSDVWSLGCMMYELVTGDVLVPAMSGPEYVIRIQELFGPTVCRDLISISPQFYELREMLRGHIARPKLLDGKEMYEFFSLLWDYLNVNHGYFTPQEQEIWDQERDIRISLVKLLMKMLQPDFEYRCSLADVLESEFFTTDWD